MLTLLGSPRRCCDGVTRRETLKAGALSLLGGFFNLPNLLALEQQRSAAARPGKAKSVILQRMAELLGESVDEWTALAGRLTEDLPEIIREAPTAVPDLLRAVRGLTADQLRRLRENGRCTRAYPMGFAVNRLLKLNTA